MARIGLSEGLLLALLGIVVGIVLVVLDKAGKLKDPIILSILLGVAAILTIPLVWTILGTKISPITIAQVGRGILTLCIVGGIYSLILIWISIPNDAETSKTMSQRSIPIAEKSTKHSEIKPYDDGQSSIVIEITNLPPRGLIIKNSGNYPVVDMTGHPLLYEFDRSPLRILNRNTRGLIQIGTLLPQKEILLSTDKIVVGDEQNTDIKLRFVRTLVLQYYREPDRKKYIRIVPFIAAKIGGKWSLFPMRDSQGTGGSTGPPELVIDVIREIEKTEKIFFEK